jgi:hypothetical protein
MRWVEDKTGRFAQRPHYSPQELDVECDKIISTFLRKRYNEVRLPISTDDLTRLIEEKADFDSYADIAEEGAEVEGLTEFRRGRRPIVRISKDLAEATNRENRLRTTLTHEYAHVHFHHFLFDGLMDQPRLFNTPQSTAVNRCHRHSIESAPTSDWLEWQAGHCCGALLMPLTALQEEVRVFGASRGCGYDGIGSRTDDGVGLIARVSGRFQVSADAARVRLLKRRILVEGSQSGTLDFLA